MAFIHRLILGGEQWLPFAQNKLRLLAGLGRNYASQNFIMPDGATVSIRVAGNQHILRIEGGGGPAYEFYTSEPIFPTTVSTGEFTGGVDSFGVTGSGTRVKPSTQKPKPLFSSFLTPDADDPQWTLRDKDYIMAENAEPVAANFKTSMSWQTQKFAEHTNWPNNASTGVTTSTQGMTAGRNSMANWDSAHRDSAFLNQFTWLHDEGEDVPPTYHDNTGSKSGMPKFSGTTPDVWARHAAVQEADGRKFFICTDNKGRFQVYPFKHYPNTEGRNYVHTYWLGVPPYPSWVTVPDPVGTRLHEWVWAFNKDATKAVSCPFNAVESELMMVEFSSNNAPNINFDMARSDVLLPEEVGRLASPLTAIPCREDIPGLVEIGIKITVTGDGEMDFSVELSLLRNVYAPADNRYIFDAVYSLPDKGDKELMGWPEDTLVTAEVQMFVAPGDYAEGPLTGIPEVGGPAVFRFNANLPTGFVVFSTNDEGMTPTERLKLQIQANDGAYLTVEGFRGLFGPSPVNIGEYPDRKGGSRGYARDAIGANMTVTRSLLGPSPCVTSALPLSGQPVPEGDDVSMTSFIFIRSLELRTMSIWYDLFDYRAGKQERILMAYNEVISTTPQGGLPVGSGPDRAILNTQRVPCSAIPHHAAMVNWMMWLRPDRGFSIHPAGHWGHASGSSASGDVVSVVPGKDSNGKPRKAVRTTHKALFNKAFTQDRDYSYYVAPDVGPLTGSNYKEFSAHALGYMGGFKTFGIWITF